MHLSAFKDCVRVDDLNKKIQLVSYNAKEKGFKKEDWFRVDGSELPNLRYTLTVSKRGYVYINFFTYQLGNLYGLALGRAGSDEIRSVVKPKYLNYYIIHPLLWLAQRVDGCFDVYTHGNLTLTNVFEYEMLGFDTCFTLIRLDTTSARSLICIDVSDFVNGLYSPVDFDDFKSIWDNRILKYGYSKHLDGYAVSDIVDLYYHVQAAFFGKDVKYGHVDIKV